MLQGKKYDFDGVSIGYIMLIITCNHITNVLCLNPTEKKPMIKPILTILSLIALPALIFAQSGNTSIRKTKKYRGEPWMLDQRVAFKLTPTSLLDGYGALCPVGIEYYLNDKFGISFDIGIPLFYVLNNYRENLHKKIDSDFKLRLDARQYFRLREKNRMYFGAEVFFRRQYMVLKDSYLHFADGNSYSYSTLTANKSVFGASALLGYSRLLSPRFILEGNVGMGFRAINMKSDLDINQNPPYDLKDPFLVLLPPNGDRVGDKDINIYIPFAIKIGYLF